jgi:hypothetical protein
MIVQPLLMYKVIEVIYRECNLRKQGWITEELLHHQLHEYPITEIRQCIYWLTESRWMQYDIYHSMNTTLNLVSKIDDNIIVSI